MYPYNVYFWTLIGYIKATFFLIPKVNFLSLVKILKGFISNQVAIKKRCLKLKSPPNFYLFLTKRCNLSCDFCHYHGELLGKDNNDSNEMNLEDIKEFVNKGIVKTPSKVCLYGGEPMLSQDFFNINNYLKEKGCLTSFISNGVYLPQYIKQLEDSFVHFATLSYYHGILNKKNQEIKRLAKKSFVNVSYIISDKNLARIEDVIQFCIDSDAHMITVENLVPKNSCDDFPISESEEYKLLKKELLNRYSSKIIFRWSDVLKDSNKDKIHCTEPWDMYLIDKTGRMLPCCQYPLSDFVEQPNIEAESFNPKEVVEMRKKMRSGVVPKGCKDCHYLYAKNPLYSFND